MTNPQIPSESDTLSNARLREQATREVLQVISQSRDDELPVLQTILEAASRLCNAPLAFVSRVNRAGTHLSIPAQRGARAEMQKVFAEAVHSVEDSGIVSAQVVRRKSIIHIADMATDPQFDRADLRRAELIDIEGVRSYLVVPMLLDDVCFGTINLYRRHVAPFSDDEIALVETFAEQAVIAVENVRQFKALETLNAELEDRVTEQVDQLERLGRLRRFLSPQVADAVVSKGDNAQLGSHRAMIAILFCDIRGFTAFCESAEPEETIEVLQTFHETLGKLIHDAGAGFDHRSGDGIMVIFNDPIPCDDPAEAALRVAFDMREAMDQLCAGWRKLGHRLGFGVGISLGYATVGMVGFEGRYDYTASGTAVNLASRLCDQAADREILLSPRAAIATEDIAIQEPAGDLTLKGFQAPVVVVRATELKRAV